MGLIEDVAKALEKRRSEVDAHNARVDAHNAAIERKIERLRKAINKLERLDDSVRSLSTSKIKKGGDHVWKGTVNSKHETDAEKIVKNKNKIGNNIAEIITDYNHKIMELEAQKENRWLL